LLPKEAAEQTGPVLKQAAVPASNTISKDVMEPCSNCQRYVADTLQAKQSARALANKLEAARTKSEEFRTQHEASEKVCIALA
jgi:hypothetical protein